jgi:hypothetical protein
MVSALTPSWKAHGLVRLSPSLQRCILPARGSHTPTAANRQSWLRATEAIIGKKNSDLASDILDAVREGTKQWTRTVKAEERSPSARMYRASRMTRERGVSLKEAAAEIMEQAHLKTSGNGSLPANARQVMYAARGHIQKETGRQLDDKYFTQILLPNYVEEHDCDWDVIYDARGHFTEPHDGQYIGLGTLEVRNYLADLHDPSIVDASLSQAKVTTNGPSGSFGAVLFIEKEGFDPILRAARIAERFDVAIMTVTAARLLADEMCSEHDIPLLLLHDFDKAGFSILGTLQRDTRRYQFQNDIKLSTLVSASPTSRRWNLKPNTSTMRREAGVRWSGISARMAPAPPISPSCSAISTARDQPVASSSTR